MEIEKLNPDWSKAAFHGKANQVGFKSSNPAQRNKKICECCLNLIEKEPIPMCENTKQLEFLGFGVPLYFKFFRSCIGLLILSTLSYHIISLYWAISHNQEYCLELEERDNHRRLLAESASLQCWTFMVRLARLQNTVSVQEQILRIAAWVLQFVFLIFTRNSLLKTAQYYDQRKTTLGDYSILMKYLTPQKNIKKKLKQFFETAFSRKHEIKQMTLLSQNQGFWQIRKEIKETNEKLRKYYKNDDFGDEFKELNAELENLTDKLSREMNQIKKREEDDQLECENVILVFEYQEIQHDILQEFKKVRKEKKEQMQTLFGEKFHKIKLFQAPEPFEILWENISHNNHARRKRKILSWIVSLVILAILTVAIYFILHAKTELLVHSLENQTTDEQTKSSLINGAIAIVYITILLILFFNKFILSFLFHKLTDFEKDQTGFSYQTSFGLKYCLGLFFTTAIMTLIVEGIQSRNFYSHLYGLIDQETLMFFSTIVFIPAFWLINPFQLFRRLKRWKNYGRKDLTQKEANLLMEDKAYDVGKRYAEIIQIVWFTLLYETLIPLGGFLSLTGLILYYWIDKFNFLRRSVLKINLSYKLPLFFLTVLEWSLVMEPVGALIFDGILRKLQPFNLATSIVMISLGLIYIILPKEKIIYWFHHEKFNLERQSYTAAKSSFVHTYHTCHPIVKIINQKKFYKRVSNIEFPNSPTKSIQSSQSIIQDVI